MFKLFLCLSLWALNANALNDPTQPVIDQRVIERTSDEVLPKLSSIMISSKGRQAVIDGRMVKVSDKLGDFEIISIDSNRVRLRREDSVFEIELVSGFFKKQNKD